MYETILYDQQDEIVIITMNRPQSLNAISKQLSNELCDALDTADNDADVKAVIVTGTPRIDGRPCFSAGADLKELAGDGYPDLTLLDYVEGLVYAEDRLPLGKHKDNIRNMGKPTIAAIDGTCTAGGIEMAMCFDIRLVSETAEISDMHIRTVGRPGGGGAPSMLTRLVGPAKAKEMIFTCKPIDGNEACRIGFANQVFPPEKLLEGAKEMAAQMAQMYQPAIRMAKAAINEAADMDLSRDLSYSRLCWAVLRDATGDEGAKAIAEKRKPSFHDK